MKRLIGSIPSLLVIVALLVAGAVYRSQLADWFSVLPLEWAGLGGRSASEAIGEAQTIPAGPFVIEAALAPDPPVVGENALVLTVRDGAGSPLAGVRVEFQAVMAAMGSMPEMRSAAEIEETPPGRYRAAFELSMRGTWNLRGRVEHPEQGHADLDMTLAPRLKGLTVISATGSGGEGAEGGVAYYTCSMHPSVKSAEPGTCPICRMDLTPVTREELRVGAIVVEEGRRQLIGVKTASARREELTAVIRAVGRVAYDETRLADVTLKFGGWIGAVEADYTGKRVEAGSTLFTIYSPELLAAQEEYLRALGEARENAARGSRLVEASRRRLRLWDIGEDVLEEIARAGRAWEYVPIRAPVGGVVIEKNIVQGSAVEPGRLLYRLADLSVVWVEADVYEFEVPLVKPGLGAQITLSYLPDRRFAGEVAYIYPYLDPTTRTGRVRLITPNPDGALKPAMYANVELARPLGERLVVPESAVVYAGQTRLVFVDLGGGRLKPRPIRVGVRTADRVEALEGLEEGEVVVTSANFLIAAESKLKAAVEAW